jgi:hypothetical protein
MSRWTVKIPFPDELVPVVVLLLGVAFVFD